MDGMGRSRKLVGPSSRAFLERTQREIPQLCNFAARKKRVPTRFPGMYARLERRCSSLHAVWHAWGTTEEERSLSFPCDWYVPPPTGCYYRAIDVLAPKEIVYRWLCQLRVAPYSYDWFDNFGRQSPRQLTPGVERLSPGQRIFFSFRVVDFEENEQITMQVALLEWFLEKVALTYRVVPSGPSSCRIVSKLTGGETGTFINRLQGDYYPIGELPLMRKQLRTFKYLAERQFLEELADGRRQVPVGDEQPRGNNVDSMGELVMQPPDGH